MDSQKRRPILYKGETYSASIQKKISMQPKEPEISFETARQNIMQNIRTVKQDLISINPALKLPTESIICLKVDAEYAAKSYYPSSLFNNGNSELDEVGTRLWKVKDEKSDLEDDTRFEKLFYVRTTEAALDKFYNRLNQNFGLAENFQLDVRKISKLELVNKNDRIGGFHSEWSKGTVEVTLHPFDLDRTKALQHFKNFISSYNINTEKLKMKQYDVEGLTFISFECNKEVVDALGDYNPLRSIHPIGMRKLPEVTRTSVTIGCPKIPEFTKKSSTIIGVIDGGYITGNPALDPYVEVIDSTTEPVRLSYAEHGTLTTSAALYGSLNSLKNSDLLTEPEITVRNFRVLSSTTSDPDLYDVIDLIEKIVPENKDISVYNLSLGPNGPILDTDVHRFTYSLDLLSKIHNVLFCVAVGNDGDMDGYDRIQSPSDMVNGIAVSAFSVNNNKVERAFYSCIGPGREGNKLKPDISAFGGCDRNPIQLIGDKPNSRTYIYGTSFASPLTAALCGKLIGKSNDILTNLTSRALLLHQSKNPESNKHCTSIGHGLLPESINDMMNCKDRSYTLIFEGEVDRTKYREFEIPWINNIQSGKVNLNWTVAVQTLIDPNSPEDYTTSSIELSFYPNSHKFTFSDPDSTSKKKIDILENPQQAANLEALGWKKSGTPVSDSVPKQFLPEGELRKELKWDTIDTRVVPKMAKSLKNPIFQVHALGRGHRNANAKVKFAIVLTIEATAAEIDLYDTIVQYYPLLLPVNIDIPVEVKIQA
jgi:Subtilase family